MTNNLDRIYDEDPAVFSKRYLSYVSQVLQGINHEEVARFVDILHKSRNTNNTVYFIGNGGSAATASHFANDLTVGVNCPEKPFRVVSLTDNQALITAIGNDYGYDDIFVRQLQFLGKPGDVLVSISASGNSANLIKAIEFAKRSKIKTVGITAFDGGRIKEISDQTVHVPTESGEYGPAEDAHLVINHLLVSYFMRFVKNANTGV